MRPAELVGIGIWAESADLLELLQALLKLVAGLKLQQEIPFQKERTASIAATSVAGQERQSAAGGRWAIADAALRRRVARFRKRPDPFHCYVVRMEIIRCSVS